VKDTNVYTALLLSPFFAGAITVAAVAIFFVPTVLPKHTEFSIKQVSFYSIQALLDSLYVFRI
jgi:hypothetical protein